MLVTHIPKMTEAFARLITQLVCHWSEASAAGDEGERPPHVGTRAAELLLAAVLQGRGPLAGSSAAPDGAAALRLRVAAAAVAARPRRTPTTAAAAERAE